MRMISRFLCLFLAPAAIASALGQTPQLPANPAPQTAATLAEAAALPPPMLFRGSLQSTPPSSTTSAAAAPDTSGPICGFKHIGTCLSNLAQDEKGIFTSPLRTQPKDAYWLAPLGAATGLAIAYDSDAAAKLGHDTSRINTAGNISNMGEFFATGGESAGIYFLGLYRKNPKLAETGRLAAESILASGTVTGALKLATNRERPRDSFQGHFWTNPPSGYTWDSSFPSGHATASMALARTIAGEYPHWYVIAPAYGFAETVSICRVLALAHFPSDVLVGQAIGFLSASYVLDHRSLYRPGAKRTMVSRMLGSVSPVMDGRTRTIGATIQIPVGQ
jgi:membrane-associated phospholipid phosphatase